MSAYFNISEWDKNHLKKIETAEVHIYKNYFLKKIFLSSLTSYFIKIRLIFKNYFKLFILIRFYIIFYFIFLKADM